MHPLIDQGLTLALYGMGTVFVLLTLLVFAIFTMSRLLKKFEYIDGIIRALKKPDLS